MTFISFLHKYIRNKLLQFDPSSIFYSISHETLTNRLVIMGILYYSLKIQILVIKYINYSVKMHDCISSEHIALHMVP